MAIKFFTDIDVKNGRVASEYPAWYYSVHVDNLRETISSLKRRLENGKVSRDTIGTVKEEIAMSEEKLSEIERCKPVLSVAEREKLQKFYKEELCPMISNSLFSYTQMQKGLADAHEEARRMVGPVIEIKTEFMEQMIKLANGKVVNKKTSRNDLAKVFKMVGRLIDEPTNIEVLRRD